MNKIINKFLSIVIIFMLLMSNSINITCAEDKDLIVENKNNSWDTSDKNNYQLLTGAIPENEKDKFKAGKILDYLFTVDTGEDRQLCKSQGGISSKKKLSFKENFVIGFKTLLGGYDRFPYYRGNTVAFGFHKDRPDYINIYTPSNNTSNETGGIGGAKDSFGLIIDYKTGGSYYSSGKLYLADTSKAKENKRDFVKLSKEENMWYNKKDYNYKGYTIKEEMAVANIKITWNAQKQQLKYILTDSMGGDYAPTVLKEFVLNVKDHPHIIDPNGEYTFMASASQDKGNNNTTTGINFFKQNKIDIINADVNGNIFSKNEIYGEKNDSYDTSIYKLKDSQYKFIKIKEGSLPEKGKFEDFPIPQNITYIYEIVPNEAEISIETNKTEYGYKEEVEVKNILINKDKREIKNYTLTTTIDKRLEEPNEIKIDGKVLTNNKVLDSYYEYNKQTRELKIYSSEEIEGGKEQNITYKTKVITLNNGEDIPIKHEVSSAFVKKINAEKIIKTKIDESKIIKKKIKYVYKHDATKEIAPSQEIKGLEGEDYNAELRRLEIEGYKWNLAQRSAPEKGKYNKADKKDVIYEYEYQKPFDPNSGDTGQVQINRRDINNEANIIEEAKVIKGKDKEPYNTDTYKELTGALKDKYEFVKIKDGDSATGVFEGKKIKQVTYLYKIKADVPADQKGKVNLKYLDTNGDIVSTKELEGIIDASYDLTKMAHPQRPGYKLVLLTKNDKGKYIKGNIEVKYQYQAEEPGKLLTKKIKYVYKHDATKKIAPSKELKGYEGEEYNAELRRLEIEGYKWNLAPSSAPEKGKYNKEDKKDVIYEYEYQKPFDPNSGDTGEVQINRSDINNEANIIEEAKVIKGKDKEPYNTDTYKDLKGALKDKYEFVKIKDGDSATGVFEGRKVKQVTYLYKIKADVPADQKGKVNIKYLDTNGDVVSTKEVEGIIDASYDLTKMAHPQRPGYKLVLLTKNDKGKYIKGSIEVKYQYQAEEPGKLLTKKIKYVYKHDASKEIAPSKELKGYEGEEYNAELRRLEIEGYKWNLAPSSAPEKGKYNKEDKKDVIYEYEYQKPFDPNSGDTGEVQINRIDINNEANIIEEAKVIKGKDKEPYNTDTYKELTGALKDKYEFVKIKDGDSATGVFEGKKIKQVTYLYKIKADVPVEQRGKINIKYLDVNGDVVSTKEVEGIVDASYDLTKMAHPQRPGYKLVLLTGNDKGKYIKGSIEVKYQYQTEDTDKLLTKKIRYVYKHDASKEIAPSKELKGYEGDDYNAETIRLEIQGYKWNLASSSAPEKGKYNKEDKKDVIYEYEYQKPFDPNSGDTGEVQINRRDINNEANIIEEAKVIKGKDKEPYNTDIYKELTGTLKDKYEFVKIKDGDSATGVFEGRKVKQVTYLYKIKDEVPADEKGKLNLKYLDVNGDVISSKEVEGIVDASYDLTKMAHPQRPGYKLVLLTKNDKGKYIKGSIEVKYQYQAEDVGKLLTKKIKYVYKHDASKEIAPSQEIKGLEGEDYNAELRRLEIEGYKWNLAPSSAPEKGKYNKEDKKDVIYEYEYQKPFDPNSGDTGEVQINRSDINNEANIIEEAKVIKGKDKEPYNTDTYKELTGALKDKYEFVKIKDGDRATGIFEGKKIKQVTYLYKNKEEKPEKNGKVEVKFITRGEKEERYKDFIIEGKIGTQYNISKYLPHIPGYRLKLVSGEEKGIYTKEVKEVIYEYTKEKQNGLMNTGTTNFYIYLISLLSLLLMLTIKKRRKN